MGNCLTIDAENDCMLCYERLEKRYLDCGHCKCRFHHKCMMKAVPGLDYCANCNKDNLRFIDMRIDEDANMYWTPSSKQIRHRHYTI